MGKARQRLTGRTYNWLQILYGRLFYCIKYINNKWSVYRNLRRSLQVDENSRIGIHHRTLFSLKNSKIIVRNGTLKIGIDFGYFDGGIYDSRTDNCRIYLVNSTLETEGNVTLFPGVVIYGVNAKITIKNGTVINGGTHIIAKKDIEIGQDCLIAVEVIIRDNDGHKLYTGNDKTTDKEIEPVRIGNHCWIGQRAMVLKGVTVEDNVIIAAGAVVAKSVSSGCVVAGVPAKVIKENAVWHG